VLGLEHGALLDVDLDVAEQAGAIAARRGEAIVMPSASRRCRTRASKRPAATPLPRYAVP
jgi:hypothetical protein